MIAAAKQSCGVAGGGCAQFGAIPMQFPRRSQSIPNDRPRFGRIIAGANLGAKDASNAPTANIANA